MSDAGPHEAAIATVRDLLAKSDYSAAGIGRLGIELGMGVRARDVPLLLRAIDSVGPLASLVQLFVLGQTADRLALEAMLGVRATEALIQAGLTRAAGERIEPLVRLTPWHDCIFAHDPDPSGDLWPEHVSGPTPAADTLLRLVSPNGGDALDLGTGCGVLAIILATGESTVVATDINPAAIRLAQVNRLLNDVASVEIRAGDLFEPVQDLAFDLIVANPPFVISPETELLFRHSSFGRDEMSRQVVREAATHLRENGFAYVLLNWVQPPDVSWMTVLEGWLDGTGCDAVCLLHGIEDPLAYSVRWTAREQQVMPERHGQTLDRWLGHLERERIQAIGSGAIILRRRSGPNWIHGLELSGDSQGDAGPHVQAIFAGRDVLERVGPAGNSNDDALLARVLRVRGPHRLTQSLVAQDGEYVAEPATVAPDEGLAVAISMPSELVPVFLRLDGTQSGHDILREVAGPPEGDPDASAPRIAAFLRQLLERGLLQDVTPGAAQASRPVS
jgi:methylase of polypeptide subunit release factors